MLGDWFGTRPVFGDTVVEVDFLAFFLAFFAGGVVNSLLSTSEPCCFVSLCNAVLTSSSFSSSLRGGFSISAPGPAVGGGAVSTWVVFDTWSSPDESAITQTILD